MEYNLRYILPEPWGEINIYSWIIPMVGDIISFNLSRDFIVIKRSIQYVDGYYNMVPSVTLACKEFMETDISEKEKTTAE